MSSSRQQKTSVQESMRLAILKSCHMAQISFSSVVSISTKEKFYRVKVHKMLKSIFLKEILVMSKFMITTTLIFLPDPVGAWSFPKNILGRQRNLRINIFIYRMQTIYMGAWPTLLRSMLKNVIRGMDRWFWRRATSHQFLVQMIGLRRRKNKFSKIILCLENLGMGNSNINCMKQKR